MERPLQGRDILHTLILPGFLGAVFCVAAILAVLTVRPPINPWIFMGSSATMLTSMVLLVRSRCPHSILFVMTIAAILLRIVYIIYFPSSDDLNRYVWEGTIQLHGYNPFTTAPDAEATTHLRNDLWNQINHPHISTIYWPFAQLLFRSTAAISPTITGFKVMVTLFDLLTLLVLGFMLRRRKLPLRLLLLYALNPLVLIAISGQGHMESIAVFLIVAALWSVESGRSSLALAVLSTAVLTKLNLIILVPFFIRAVGWKKIIWLFIPLLLFLPYVTASTNFLSTPLLFAREFSYNGMLQEFATWIFGLDRALTLRLLAITLATGVGVIFLLIPSLLRASSLSIGLLLLCMPTVHPWYFVLMAPFVVFFREGSWLLLQFTTLFVLFFFVPSVQVPFFHNRHFLIVIEYLPFIVLGGAELFLGRKRWPVRYGESHAISVIIPTRNEAANIAACIQSIRCQNIAVETIVVDSGSTDATCSIIAEFADVKLLTAPPGRGIQIAEGIRSAHGDTIVVLHADAQLEPGALQNTVAQLNAHPDAAGGAMHARYDHAHWRMKLTQFLNRVRARYFGIAFGDQAQFFRRAALPDGFPEYKLMEDVELSLRLKEHGTLLYLNNGLTSSSRRWRSHSYFSNFMNVIGLTLLYLLSRSSGHIRNNASFFYNLYYGKQS